MMTLIKILIGILTSIESEGDALAIVPSYLQERSNEDELTRDRKSPGPRNPGRP